MIGTNSLKIVLRCDDTKLQEAFNKMEQKTYDACYKVGRVVMIYEDPITRKKPEGKAKLLKLVDKENRRWEVKFISDGFVCERFIK